MSRSFQLLVAGVVAATLAASVRAQDGVSELKACWREGQTFITRSYAWENIDFSDPKAPKTVEKGTVVADEYGLVTVPKFKVGDAGLGNRLAIRPSK